jgi:hypothetical protein
VWTLQAAEADGRARAAQLARAEAEGKAGTALELESVQKELLATITKQADENRELKNRVDALVRDVDQKGVALRREERRWRRAETLLDRYREAEKKLLGPSGMTLAVESEMIGDTPAFLAPGSPRVSPDADEEETVPRISLDVLEQRLRRRIEGELRATLAVESRQSHRERAEQDRATAEAMRDARSKLAEAENELTDLRQWRRDLLWAEGVVGLRFDLHTVSDAASRYLASVKTDAESAAATGKAMMEDVERVEGDGWSAVRRLGSAAPVLCAALGKAEQELKATQRQLALARGEASDLKDELFALEQAERRDSESSSAERKRLRDAVRRIRQERDDAKGLVEKLEVRVTSLAERVAVAENERELARRDVRGDRHKGARDSADQIASLQQQRESDGQKIARLRAQREALRSRLGSQAQYAARAMALVRERDLAIADLEARTGVRARIAHFSRTHEAEIEAEAARAADTAVRAATAEARTIRRSPSRRVERAVKPPSERSPSPRSARSQSSGSPSRSGSSRMRAFTPERVTPERKKALDRSRTSVSPGRSHPSLIQKPSDRLLKDTFSSGARVLATLLPGGERQARNELREAVGIDLSPNDLSTPHHPVDWDITRSPSLPAAPSSPASLFGTYHRSRHEEGSYLSSPPAEIPRRSRSSSKLLSPSSHKDMDRKRSHRKLASPSSSMRRSKSLRSPSSSSTVSKSKKSSSSSFRSPEHSSSATRMTKPTSSSPRLVKRSSSVIKPTSSSPRLVKRSSSVIKPPASKRAPPKPTASPRTVTLKHSASKRAPPKPTASPRTVTLKHSASKRSASKRGTTKKKHTTATAPSRNVSFAKPKDTESLASEDVLVTDRGADAVAATLDSPDSLALSSLSEETTWTQRGGQLQPFLRSPSSRVSPAVKESISELHSLQGRLGRLEADLRRRL